MNAPSGSDALQGRIKAHYDRFPFVFDQEEILEEKLRNRVMGEALLGLDAADARARVLDVGSGPCRVARLVRSATGRRAISIDLSLETLRAARVANPDPMVNGDNQRLPLASDCADLVISNGVIHHTPDARRCFLELARITRPGGTLVVSVYNRHCWYYPVYTYAGAVVRAARRAIGDRGLRWTFFPIFHVGSVLLLSAATRRLYRLPLDSSWNLFHDQLTTPQCTFHTFEELRAWAAEAGLTCVEERTEAARQLLTVRLEKPAR